MLPSTQELPCSDDTPVDNEDQNLLPNLLLFSLAILWSERMDWYFGVDMIIGGIEQEVLLWYNGQGQAYPMLDQRIHEMQDQLAAERQRADRLATYLRSLGVDPDQLPE